MPSALLTATTLSVLGLAASVVLGQFAETSQEVIQHVSLAVFVTMMTLLSHSMLMFYLIGKGKAVREAVAEASLSADFVVEISRARKPVFSVGMPAIFLTIVAAVIGAGVDTGAIPSWFHGLFGYCAVLSNVVLLRAEYIALTASTRTVAKVNRLLGV